jgi:hypothetical protein
MKTIIEEGQVTFTNDSIDGYDHVDIIIRNSQDPDNDYIVATVFVDELYSAVMGFKTQLEEDHKRQKTLLEHDKLMRK